MPPFSRPLRKRVRRLIPPPSFDINKVNQYSPSIDIEISNPEPISSPKQLFEDPIISHSVKRRETRLGLDEEIDPVEALKAEILEQNVFSELSEVLEEGVYNVLESSDTNGSGNLPNYEDLNKKQFKRAVKDYIDAGEKFQESGLHSNAATAFAFAVLAELLAESAIESAIKIMESIKVTASFGILGSSIFSLLNSLFDVWEQQNILAFKHQIEKLKHLETFSLDDQELLASAIDFLTSIKV